MAEKNIAALLDSMAFTIHVAYQHGSDTETYTYVCNLPEISAGDFVVVPTKVRNTTKYRVSDEQDMEGYVMKGNAKISAELYAGAERLLQNQRLTIAKVVSIDETVELQPDDAIEYAWVIQKVDLSVYQALLTRNKQITDAVQEAYKRNIRKSFAERVLGELPDADKSSLLKLLGK